VSIFDTIANAESGNRNIANTTAGTSSGQAQGFYQITTGTWTDFAPKAGISLAQYPNPMTAADGSPVPQSVQQQVASQIPLNRWASSTVAAVQAQYGGGLDTSQTVGQIHQANDGSAIAVGGGSGTFEILGPDGTPQGAQRGSDPSGLPPGYTVGHEIAGGSTTTGTDGTSTMGAAMPGYLPPAATGGPMALGLSPGLATALQGDVTSAETATGAASRAISGSWLASFENWVSRFFLVLVAIVLLGIALWWTLSPASSPLKLRRA
jgi:hypothetical protein